MNSLGMVPARQGVAIASSAEAEEREPETTPSPMPTTDLDAFAPACGTGDTFPASRERVPIRRGEAHVYTRFSHR